MIYKNGDIYVGEFEADKRQGKGELTRKDGSEFKGYWKNDKQCTYEQAK